MRSPLVLTVAGSDPTGGAGLELDLAVIVRLGGLGMACASALTVQDTVGVHAVHPLSGALIEERLGVLLDDVRPDAVKVGMLAGAEQVSAVERGLRGLDADVPLVLDPVLVSSSGAELLDEAGRKVLLGGLARRARVLTPNREEARRLAGRRNDEATEGVADDLVAMGMRAVLVTGGDEGGTDVIDRLVDGARRRTWRDARILGPSPHGTGCALSTAIAVFLGLGWDLEEAVDGARRFVRAGIRGACVVGRKAGGRRRLRWDLRLDSRAEWGENDPR